MTPHAVASLAALTGVLTVMVALQVLALRAVRVLRERRAVRATSLWQPLLIDAIHDPPAALPALARRDVRTFLSIWNHLHETVLDEAKERLNDVATRLGVPAMARRMAARGHVGRRLLGVVTLGQLRDRSMWEALAAAAAQPSMTLSLAAARALIQIDARAGIERLMPLVASRLDWPPSRVVQLLQAAGPDVISGPLARAALAADAAHAPRLIRYLDVVHCETAIPTVRQIVHRINDADVLGACLRVFRDPEDLDTVRAFLGDPRWQVRVQAASALGRVGTADDEPRLARMLGDPEWWVRYRAAHAVAALLADAPDRLDRLQRQHPNPFARDILRQVQAERQLQ